MSFLGKRNCRYTDVDEDTEITDTSITFTPDNDLDRPEYFILVVANSDTDAETEDLTITISSTDNIVDTDTNTTPTDSATIQIIDIDIDDICPDKCGCGSDTIGTSENIGAVALNDPESRVVSYKVTVRRSALLTGVVSYHWVGSV